MKQADVAKRIAAYLIDYFALYTITSIISIPFFCLIVPMMWVDGDSPYYNPAMVGPVTLLLCCGFIIYGLACIAVSYAYHVWVPVKKWDGASVGKRAMGMTIRKANGDKVTQTDLFVREFIGKFISAIAFYLGFIWIFVDEKGQGWHDKIADTMVVEDKK